MINELDKIYMKEEIIHSMIKPVLDVFKSNHFDLKEDQKK